MSIEKSEKFINLIGLSLSKQDIQSIRQVYYLGFEGYIKYYNLNILIKDGRTYTAVFIQPNYNNNTNYDDLKLITLTLSGVNWLDAHFSNELF